jgi:hypothetical protein
VRRGDPAVGRAETLNCMYFDFNWHKVYNYRTT